MIFQKNIKKIKEVFFFLSIFTEHSIWQMSSFTELQAVVLLKSISLTKG